MPASRLVGANAPWKAALHELSRTSRNGVRLCKLHGAQKERGPATGSTPRRVTTPRAGTQCGKTPELHQA